MENVGCLMVKIPSYQKTLREFFEEQETVYLDSTELVGYAKKYLIANKKHVNDCAIRSLSRHFVLLSSDLVRFEVITALRKEFKALPYASAQIIFTDIINEFRILVITPIDSIRLTREFLEKCAKSRVDLKDGIHLLISANLNVKMVTFDKKLLANKEKFYREVYSHNDIIKLKFTQKK